MTGLFRQSLLDDLQAGALGLLPHWGFSPSARLTLLSVSENAIYRVDDPSSGDRAILRVHRPEYHTRAEIESELDWIAALRADGAAMTPGIRTMADGARIGSFTNRGATRHVVIFDLMDGAEPDTSRGLVGSFAELGAVTARLHDHARQWRRPAGFQRKTWDFETTVGATPHWGSWRNAPGMTDAGRALLARTCASLRQSLAAYGKAPQRFGLIHADLLLANLLADGNRLTVIDFDDCGFGWFLYDFAGAVSLLDRDPLYPELRAAWLQGYRSQTALSAEDEAMIPVFVMLRRITLTAWSASHAETESGKALGVPYTEGTLAMADRYLSALD